MKQLHGNGLILGVTAMTILAAQPVWAQITQITDVQLKSVDGGISVVLRTSSGNRPQVFTTKRGKALVADIINTQLRLPQGNSFHQDNPAPGVASVEIAQLDANSVRVMVTGSQNAPSNQPVVRKQDGITLSFSIADLGKMPPQQVSQAAAKPTAGKIPVPQQAPTPSQLSKKPDVLVPNPQVSIDGKPASPDGLSQPQTPAPPFLPRAVAPPVGDIAISNLDASPTTIDLGTQERVPRLVLRDAPVREVLSLLARAAGLNLAYAAGTSSGGQSSPGRAASAAGAGDGPTISLDIENEPVQDVFNYVLRLSGLEANRSGRTVFVGPNLPNATRDVVMRSLRLNQVTVGVALNFLVSLGAESAVSRERQVTSVSAVPQVVTAEKTSVGLTVAVKIDRIDDNGFVSLSVAPNIKAPEASAQVPVGSGTQTITLVSERSLQSGLIRLRDGQTLILSGIIQDTDRTTVSKIPILGDIPLLGALFRKTNRQNQRQEVIVLLTPQILDDSEHSSFGYNYKPSPEVRQMLEHRGLQVPSKK